MDGLDLKQTTTIGPLNETPHQSGAGPIARPGHDPELLAERVARTLDLKEILDVSSARAGLEAAFADHSITVKGFDLGSARGPVADFPPGPWELIVCLDALEHLSGEQADALVATLSEHGDRVLVSTGRLTQAELATAFARHGLFHRVDLDVEFAEAGTVLFERDTLAPQDIVGRYEQALAPLRAALSDPRTALPGEPAATGDTEADLRRQIDELRHQTLTSRDFAIGAEAEISHLQAERESFRAALDEVYSSTSWLLIRRGVAPLGKRLKRLAGRNR